MVGYSEQSKGYRLYNPATKKVLISRDVVFIESNDERVISSAKVNRSVPPKASNVRRNKSKTVPITHDLSSDSSDSDSSDNESSDSDSKGSEAGVNSEPEFSEANPIQTTKPTSAPPDDSVVIIEQNAVENGADGGTNSDDSAKIEFSEADLSENSLYTSFLNATDFDVAASETATVSSPNFVPEETPTRQARHALGMYAMMAAAAEDVDEPKTFNQAIQSSE